MAKIEPITGRYIWVPYEGEEYRIYYEEAGTGIPMVCLHTAGTDGREWRHQLCDEKINENFRVIAFDMPRHGKSIPPYDWYKEEEEYKLTAKFYAGIIGLASFVIIALSWNDYSREMTIAAILTSISTWAYIRSSEMKS